MHNKILLLAATACLMVLAVNASALAVKIRPPSIPERVSGSDAIVVGKVESIEDKTVKAKPIYGGDDIEYQVAVVKVTEGMSGVKGLTHVKVAFPVDAGGRPGPIGRRFPQPKLEKDQEGCLFLRKHPTETFYVMTTADNVIDKKAPNFDDQLSQTKKLTKLIDGADKNLKSK